MEQVGGDKVEDMDDGMTRMIGLDAPFGVIDKRSFDNGGQMKIIEGEQQKGNQMMDKASNVAQSTKESLQELIASLNFNCRKYTYGVFPEPVDPNEFPDYHEIIEHPMDFRTVRKKLEGCYSNLDEFQVGFELWADLWFC
ncbi:hypothetical protein TEA_004674 [Camellia sinensis var. sinensis]|uniref:Bromo domain-containing protein n=1 Tax=Camellia sinensis var. sinensis TaxID=542762 RepID=A0A4S4DQQ8_CAMSN|nr:hypothetical protein TEA_004674 [Camellia sinensis var. sinensis]